MAIKTTLTLGFNGAAVKKGLKEVGNAFARIGKLGAKIGASIISPFAKLAALLGPTAIVGGMAAFAKSSSDAASSMENLKAQLEIFTGSGAKAETMMKDLRKLAVESPLEFEDVVSGAKRLLQYGVATEEVIGHVTRLSEVSAGNAQQFERLTLAFGQAASIGRLMGTELRQFTESGFNPLEYIAKKTGETMLQLRKRMEDGGISITEVKEALKSATSEGGRFFGMNQKMAKTFSGQVSKMKDEWNQLSAQFGEGLNEGLKSAIAVISSNIPKFTEKFKTAGVYIGNAISDSVNGNYDKFVAIGDLIGSAITAGTKAALEKGWLDLGVWVDKNLLDKLASAFTGESVAMSDRAKNLQSPSFGSILQSNMESSQIREKAAALSQGNQGLVPGTGGRFRYAQDGESSVFSDAQGNKVIEVLRSIDRSLQPTP